MKSKTARILCGIGAAIGGLCSALFELMPHSVAAVCGDWLMSFIDIMAGNAVSEHNGWIGFVVLALVYAAPAALYSGLVWLVPESRQKAFKAAFLSAGLVTLVSVLMIFTQGLFGFIAFLATALGSFGCIGCIWLYKWLEKKLPTVFNRETVSYIVFGVLTTVVSFVSQMLFSAAGFPVIVNTIGSWVCAVLFAYIVNKLFVFESKTDTAKAFWRELVLFIGARVASLGMELVFMFVTVELLHFSEAVCKLIAQVFILVANYIFSKLFIFKKT